MSKTKHDVLIENGWECLIGYQLDFEKDSDMSSVLISRKDVEKFYSQSPKNYYYTNHDEYSVDEDEAWERFHESYCEEHNLDISLIEFDKKMLEEQHTLKG